MACDIAALYERGEISAADALWALLHNEFLTDEQMRAAARHWALGVIHMWDAPPVVVQYLESGDEELKGNAWLAASGAYWAADDGTARSAALAAYCAAAYAAYAADLAAYAAAAAATDVYYDGHGDADAMAVVEAEQIVYLLGVIG
jgi:hypothetical protein